MTKKRKDSSIYSDEFKREVDKAHKQFFSKRGINPNGLDGEFLFGIGRPRKSEDSPSWSQHSSDQPNQQSSQ